MDKLDMHSANLTERNIDKIAELFPMAITERLDDEGNPARAIDFDVLRQELSGHVVEGSPERYHLDWPGKRASSFAASEPIAKTMRPIRQESINFDETGNVFIEGDNLDALKLLQESYLGRVNVIYIDPPYNTGNDFIYDDDFAEGVDEYLTKSDQIDEAGKRLVTNTDANGRFHSDWLSMMYPRLKLARNLLADDGLLFVSIGEVELASLKLLCDQVFGEQNLIAIAPRKTGAGSAATRSEAAMRKLNDYILIYRRSAAGVLARKIVGRKEYPFADEHGRYTLGQFQASGSDATRAARPNMWYPIYATDSGTLTTTMPSGEFIEILPRDVNGEEGRWLWSREKFENDKDTLIHFDGKLLSRKIYFDPELDQTVYQVEKAWFDEYTNASGTTEVADLFGVKKIFDHPKPVALLAHLIKLHPAKDGIVLDFFGGSASTAHAVMRANIEDGGSRTFIIVQLPEPIDPASPAGKAGYASISELGRERVRRAGRQAKEEAGLGGKDLDTGFRAFMVDSSNLSDVLRTPDNTAQQVLSAMESSIKADRSAEDLLFQVLLDWGLTLTMPISLERLGERDVLVVDNGALIAHFGSEADRELIRAIAERQPLRAVFNDAGFQSDDARINAEQIFAEVSPSTDVKVI